MCGQRPRAELYYVLYRYSGSRTSKLPRALHSSCRLGRERPCRRACRARRTQWRKPICTSSATDPSARTSAPSSPPSSLIPTSSACYQPAVAKCVPAAPPTSLHSLSLDPPAHHTLDQHSRLFAVSLLPAASDAVPWRDDRRVASARSRAGPGPSARPWR